MIITMGEEDVSMDRDRFIHALLYSPMIIVALALILSGCSSASKARVFKVDKSLLVKDVYNFSGKVTAGIPMAKFSAKDSEVISYVKLRDVSGSHNLRWEWYDPYGKLYETSDDYPVYVSEGNYVEEINAWHKISLKGERAQDFPGNWTVYVYYDNERIAKNSFELETPAMAAVPVVVLPKVSDEIPFVADIDSNIPVTGMNNPDAIAVVIGNRKYKNNDIPEVRFAQNDAKIMKEYLIKMLGYKESNIIFKTDATKAEFEQIFGIKGNYEGRLYDLVKPDKSDVFVYYSGHGAPDIDTKKGYFVPSDCESTKFALSGYPLEVFLDNVSQLKAKHVTVVLDACFSGGSNSGKYLIASSSLFGIKVSNPIVSKGNSICMTSSEGDQISSWYDTNNHGLFTYFFLKGLRGDANRNRDNSLTYEELYEYVSDNTEGVPYWARRLHQGRKQNPTIQGLFLNRPLVKY